LIAVEDITEAQEKGIALAGFGQWFWLGLSRNE
jgi:hypothetical protein